MRCKNVQNAWKFGRNVLLHVNNFHRIIKKQASQNVLTQNFAKINSSLASFLYIIHLYNSVKIVKIKL